MFSKAATVIPLLQRGEKPTWWCEKHWHDNFINYSSLWRHSSSAMGTWIYFQISQFSHAFQFSAWSWCCVISSTKWNSFINNYSGDSSKWDYRNSNGLRHLLKTGIGCQVLKIESLARLSMASRSLPLVRTSQSHAFHWLSRLLQAPVCV